MNLAKPGRDIIKNWEGLALVAYVCPAGILTIGWGHTGSDVTPGMKVTQEQAEFLLSRDVAKAERAVKRLITVPITQNQFDALVSFTFNLGGGNLQASTLRKVINRGDIHEVPAQFRRWVFAGGKKLRGLQARREEEIALFMKSEVEYGERVLAANDSVGYSAFRRFFSFSV